MPIHLFWGNDSSSRNLAIEDLIQKIVDPTWSSINISRLDGKDIDQVNKALEEVRTPPFGSGSRVVLIKQSPFCNGCSSELGKRFEDVIELIPQETHLILSNELKPDGRLKTTKTLQQLIKSNRVNEQNFLLPAIWDIEGQKQFVIRIAKQLGLSIQKDAVIAIVEAIGSDSSRLRSELEKLSLLESSKCKEMNQKYVITIETVKELVGGITTNSLEIGNYLLQGNIGETLFRINSLLDTGEPALRILASLTTQIRGWLWVSLLEKNHQNDVSFIAKAAGIANPKRIYIIRKQIHGKPPSLFIELLNRFLDIEVSLKKGVHPSHAFQDSLLKNFDFSDF
tara:strand:- start:4131 stop:5147 length:1017 start_codon:yes stop_codon:yes gene_type:complete